MSSFLGSSSFLRSECGLAQLSLPFFVLFSFCSRNVGFVDLIHLNDHINVAKKAFCLPTHPQTNKQTNPQSHVWRQARCLKTRIMFCRLDTDTRLYERQLNSDNRKLMQDYDLNIIHTLFTVQVQKSFISPNLMVETAWTPLAFFIFPTSSHSCPVHLYISSLFSAPSSTSYSYPPEYEMLPQTLSYYMILTSHV